MKAKKIIAMLLAVTAIAGACAGCGGTKEATTDGKVSISIGNWPSETDQKGLEKKEAQRVEFMTANPNIDLKGDTWAYDTKTFTMKAAGGQLPTVYNTWLTEISNMIAQGYIADITDEAKATGYLDALNPDLMEFVTDKKGRVYGLPWKAYAQGLHINKRLFKEAGLVEADGETPKVPQTYQELAEFSQIIREKTGKAGLAFPTTNNCGGWHFMNIAWSFGVDFVEKDGDKWVAAFNTPEAVEALQYIKDLKWKYNALLDDSVITSEDLNKWFGSYQAAMFIGNPPQSLLPSQYGMEIDDIYVAGLPAGPKGRYAQTGADIYVFSNNASSEEITAAIEWLKFTGFAPEVTEEQLNNSRTNYELQRERNYIVLHRSAFDIWVNKDRVEKETAVMAEYANVKPENYDTYFEFDGIQLRGEPEVCAQQLYAILDGCIQEVITNKDADVAALIETAANDYQVNHLDKMAE